MRVTVKTGYVTVGKDCYKAGEAFDIDDDKGAFLVMTGVCEGNISEAKAKKPTRKKKAEEKDQAVSGLPAVDLAGAIVK